MTKDIPFNSYKKLIKLSYGQFSRWLSNLCKIAYEEGLRDGESELDNATVDEWMEFIEKTPGHDEVFSIALTTEEFCKKLEGIQGLGPKMLDKICREFNLYEEEEEENGGSVHEEAVN